VQRERARRLLGVVDSPTCISAGRRIVGAGKPPEVSSLSSIEQIQ
jgi:hypothetical protein